MREIRPHSAADLEHLLVCVLGELHHLRAFTLRLPIA